MDAIGLQLKAVLGIWVIWLHEPDKNELLSIYIERVRFLSQFVECDAVPLLNYLPIDFKDGTEAASIVISHYLRQIAFDEHIECGAYGDFAVKDLVLTLTDDRNVVFCDGWRWWKFRH